MFANHTSTKGLVCRIYEDLSKLNNKKITQLKCGHRFQIGSSKKTYRWQMSPWGGHCHYPSWQWQCNLNVSVTP